MDLTAPWGHAWAGRLDELTIDSEALTANPLGDPHRRPVWVYTPPGYDEDAVLRATVRMQRLSALTGIAELVAARRDPAGGWEIAMVRHGRLAAAATAPPGVHPRTTLEVARVTAETVRPGPGPVPAASAAETERILAWLERPDTRLVEASSGWASPVRGAARFRNLLIKAEFAASAKDSTDRS